MATTTVTGNAVATLFDRNLVDMADGDNFSITFPNDLMAVTTGKNGNTIFAKNETGNVANVVVRINRSSSDDRFLAGKLAEMERDPATFTLAEGEFVIRSGDGQGNVFNDIYTLQGGVFVRKVDGKENLNGDTEQAVSVYNMTFARASRSIG